MSNRIMPAFGKVLNEPIQDYHATDVWSKSKLDDFRRQPLYAWRKYVAKTLVEPAGDSSALLIGHSSHTLLLEGLYEYHNRYAIVPEDAPKRPTKVQLQAKKPSDETLAQIRWWDEFARQNLGKTVIDAEAHRLNETIASVVRAHKTASELLSSGDPEITWRVQLGRFPVQCRSDWFNANGCELTNGEPYVVDLKTVASNDANDFTNFERNFFKLGYYRQAPFYNAVISEVAGPVKHFFFIAVEKKEPFEVKVFRATPRAFGIGWDEVKEDLEKLDECYRTGIWPGAPEGILDIDIPNYYAIRRELDRGFALVEGGEN